MAEPEVQSMHKLNEGVAMVGILPSGRRELVDQHIAEDQHGKSYSKFLFRRVDAKSRRFENVDFSFTIFDNCYLRDCQFKSCTFTGAAFVDCNLRGSSFDGSKFDYARFSRTLIGHSILERHMPGYENVQLELARNLRVNYAQLGDTEGVNLAILSELGATRTHLSKSWRSKEGYYRDKYKRWDRARAVAKHLWFVILDIVWGNGESLPKIARTIALCVIVLAGLATWCLPAGGSWLLPGLSLYFGTPLSGWIPPFGLAVLGNVLRLITFGMLIAVLTKRLNRR